MWGRIVTSVDVAVVLVARKRRCWRRATLGFRDSDRRRRRRRHRSRSRSREVPDAVANPDKCSARWRDRESAPRSASSWRRVSLKRRPPRLRIRNRLRLRPPSRKRSASRRQPRCATPGRPAASQTPPTGSPSCRRTNVPSEQVARASDSEPASAPATVTLRPRDPKLASRSWARICRPNMEQRWCDRRSEPATPAMDHDSSMNRRRLALKLL